MAYHVTVGGTHKLQSYNLVADGIMSLKYNWAWLNNIGFPFSRNMTMMQACCKIPSSYILKYSGYFIQLVANCKRLAILGPDNKRENLTLP